MGGVCSQGVLWKLRLPVYRLCLFLWLMGIIANTKLPQVGELVLTRIISQFRKSFKQNNKVGVFFFCNNFFLLTTYILLLLDCLPFHHHLSHPFILSITYPWSYVLCILVLLLEQLTDDSIKITIGFTHKLEVRASLSENSPKANATIFKPEQFCAVLPEGKIYQGQSFRWRFQWQIRIQFIRRWLWRGRY